MSTLCKFVPKRGATFTMCLDELPSQYIVANEREVMVYDKRTDVRVVQTLKGEREFRSVVYVETSSAKRQLVSLTSW